MRRVTYSIVSLAVLGACSDLSEFRADGEEEAFIGVAYGTEAAGDCETGEDCSFIRRGMPVGTLLTLTFDPDPTADPPGRLTTSDDRCGGSTFEDTPLQVIEPLARDHLSLYDFPGPGRIRNYVFVASPDEGPFQGREVYAFLSLLRGGRIEVRLIAGTGRDCLPDDCDAYAAGSCDLFAIFTLDKTAVE